MPRTIRKPFAEVVGAAIVVAVFAPLAAAQGLGPSRTPDKPPAADEKGPVAPMQGGDAALGQPGGQSGRQSGGFGIAADAAGAGVSQRDADTANLAQLLAQAMSRNPDILVAEAKVRGAQAELDRARLDVARQLIDALQSVRRQQKVIEIAREQAARAKENRNRVQELHKTGTTTGTELAAASAAVGEADLSAIQAEADLEQAMAALDYLIGRGGGGGGATGGVGMMPGSVGGMTGGMPGYGIGPPGVSTGGSAGDSGGRSTGGAGRSFIPQGGGSVAPPQPGAAGPQAPGAGIPGGLGSRRARNVYEDLYERMQQPTNLEVVESPLAEVMKYFDDLHGIANIVIDDTADTGRMIAEQPITLRLSDVPLGAALKAIEDTGSVKFYAMDYGLRVTDKDKKIEEGTPLREFLARPPGFSGNTRLIEGFLAPSGYSNAAAGPANGSPPPAKP